jgi:UDP-N-acetylglucosamine--N-acetylmuramyl-(pentapeptide) pyrophosphoryl-undecaprenol N-acetylglucosamine transferase
MVTGGSQGSEHMNLAMREILPEVLKFSSVGLIAGRKHYEDMVDLKKYEEWDKAKLQSNFRMWEFSSVLNELLGAADVVVSRAGMTTIAELATLGKPVILVPFEKLPGGHQLKNAERLERGNAILMVKDGDMVENPNLLLEAIRTLVRSPKKREELSEKLHTESKTDAATRLADILIENA